MTKFRALVAGVGIVVMSWASGAVAQTPYVGTEVRGVDVQRAPGTQPATVESVEVVESVEESGSDGLPVTGGDLAIAGPDSSGRY